MERQLGEVSRANKTPPIPRESNGKGQKVTQDVIDKIVALRKEGIPYHNIGLILGKSTNTVFRHCKKAGLWHI